MNKFVKAPNTFCHYLYGSNLTLANASPDKKYMQRLAKCKNYAKAAEIYPGIKNPIKDDLVELWKRGYVERYTMPKYLKTWINSNGNEYVYATRIWWKTTEKGNELLNKFGM